MKVGRKPKPESPEEMALVHHALENPIRRRMIILMVEGCRSAEGIAESVGLKMLDYHLKRMELAGLIIRSFSDLLWSAECSRPRRASISWTSASPSQSPSRPQR
ncbi:MAG TPA: helix-turn-helix domain-containing protein [Methanothrix sp.]|nr:helix-turn-helix domain-containing protein [Methanothrix sp.]